MIEQQITVTNPKGLHARPSALLVKTAMTFDSDISLTNDGKTADAKSVLGIMTLCAKAGTELTLKIEGHDETLALKAIIEVFNTKYDD